MCIYAHVCMSVHVCLSITVQTSRLRFTKLDASGVLAKVADGMADDRLGKVHDNA